MTTTQRPAAIALITIMMVTAVALIAIATVSSFAVGDLQIGSAATISEQTYQAAEGGIQDALYKLSKDATLTTLPNQTINGVTVVTTISGSSFPKTIDVVATGPGNIVRRLEIIVHRSTFGGLSGAALAGSGGLQIDHPQGTINDSLGKICSIGNIFGTGTINGNIRIATGSSITGVTVNGTIEMNQSCQFPPIPSYFFNSTNPSDPNWNSSFYKQAQDGGPFSAVSINNSTVHITKGIYPSITINGHGSVIIDSGPIWVTGSVTFNNPGASIVLNSSIFSSGQSTALVAETGTIDLKNNGQINGITYTGTPVPPASYLFVATLSNSGSAVIPANNNTAALYYAPNGTINISSNGVELSNATGKTIYMKNDTITYDSGLRDLFIVGNPAVSILPEPNSWTEK